MASLLQTSSKAILVCLALLAVPAAAGQTGSTCHGFDEQWGTCADLPSCEECTPVDCQFGDWGSWYDSFGHCTGLKFRERTIAVTNNECGQPCDGPKIMSVEHVPEDCVLEKKHCELSEWSEWSQCSAQVGQAGQVYRKRTVQSVPQNGGLACEDDILEETKVCGIARDTVDCKVSEWQEWTQCSVTCGNGRYTRMRRVTQAASPGGELCHEELLQTKACKGALPCPGKDCILGEWNEWSFCDDSSETPTNQRFRKREVQQHGNTWGTLCNETLHETQGCPVKEAVDCVMSEWSEWRALGSSGGASAPTCNKDCGGGQAFRTREIQSQSQHGGTCPGSSLKELKACNTHSCSVDCVLEEWADWSACSVDCGQGRMTRKRAIKNPDQLHSDGCQGATEEVHSCMGAQGPCPVTDCAWGQWTVWSSCTASCGGGTMHRNRAIQVRPENGGAKCEALTKSEAAPCNTHTCGEECLDGTWSSWGAWSPCSATCGGAYSTRSRSVATQPNHCGRPPAGISHEYKACDQTPCAGLGDTDCQVSEWSEWSACTCTCFGTKERARYIKVTATGAGKRCSESLKETSPCSPGVGDSPSPACLGDIPTDCKLGQWSEWSTCSKPCGGGQRERSRKVVTPAKSGGAACSDTLSITAPCNPEACSHEDCLDCQWDEWSEWGDCSGCAGERYRHRSIKQMPNACGRMCDLKSAKEVSKCTGQCEANYFCTWTEWTASLGCELGSCGTSTSMRSRALTLTQSPDKALFALENGARCMGAQMNLSMCEAAEHCQTCTPVDCEFTEWSAWSAPNAASKLCERTREPALHDEKCVKPCSGTLVETKECGHDNPNRRDCLLGEWENWSECALNGKVGQKYRKRAVNQEPTPDGTPCEGTLHETAMCSPIEPKHCMLSEWGDWAACGASCGGGFQSRQRNIVVHAEHNGNPCQDSLDEMRTCNSEPCKSDSQDCSYGEWTLWEKYGDDGQCYRSRLINPARGAGAPCTAGLRETRPCETEEDMKPKHCVLSEWTEWDTCDETCGIGQQRTQRQIMEFPENGGQTCDKVDEQEGGALMKTRGCEAKEACSPEDCKVSEWEDWSVCSAQCGTGQRTRRREVLQNRGLDGVGCNLNISEVARCEMPACEREDCQWGEWMAWDTCSCTCDGGQQTRVRHLAKMPSNGGRLCQVQDKAEVRACNTQSCELPAPEDGEWALWSEWSSCSVTCGGGTQFRTRQIAKMAKNGGAAVTGNTHEINVCNEGVPCEEPSDCEFSGWGLWSDCTKTCHGIKRRARRIERYGKGYGKECQGSLKEISSCNPDPDGVWAGGTDVLCGDVQAEAPMDCKLSEWSLWSACPVTCGGGEHTRTRFVEIHASNGGAQCEGALEEATQCNVAACEGPQPRDCEFGEWGEWGHCDHCNGQRYRFKHLLQDARYGGKNCDSFVSEEAQHCNSTCDQQLYCTWGSWETWGSCTAKCGQGKRMRRRYLSSSYTEAALPQSMKELMSEYEGLRFQAQHFETGRVQELSLAFAGGLLSFVSLFAASRAAFVRVSAPRGNAAWHAAWRAAASSRAEEMAATKLPLVGMA
uniref:Spondin-like TSP1 domain-containing protein n=2 Tax=Alexandrium andersonii TaxID=327968 RepID=A0A7S2E114_9DINO